MGNTLINLPDSFGTREWVHGLADEFNDIILTRWTKVGGAEGTATVSDGVGGIVDIAVTNTDNNEQYLASEPEAFLMAASKPISFQCIAGFTEADTDKASVFMGCVDGVAADLLVDTGGGPKTTASGFAFEKRETETEWRCWYSVGTTQDSQLLSSTNKNNLSNTSQAAGTAGPTYKLFQIDFVPEGSGKAYITFSIDGQVVCQFYNVDYSSATEMQVALGIKAGSANAETLKVDAVDCYQKR